MTATSPRSGRAARPACATVLGPVPGWRRVELDQQARRVRLPAGTQLDLGATAKAWAADHCAELIAGRLGCGVLVSLGGDLAVAGPVPGAAGGSGSPTTTRPGRRRRARP